ncbi:hypothetical protein ACOBV8_20040 (plasmid) [Pseudoalteromonas espejiana]
MRQTCEVFGASSQTFYNVEDPCRAENIANLSNAATRTANCAALGVASDFNSGATRPL